MASLHWWVLRLGVATILFALETAAWADGGQLQLSQIVEGYRVTVFSSPTPLRVGEVDFSILVQEVQTGRICDDVPIVVKCRNEASHFTIFQTASQDQAANQFMQSAICPLTTPDRWRIELELAAPVSTTVNFQVDIGEPSTNGRILWFGIALPVVLVGLFLLREKITPRTDRRRSAG